MNFTRICCHLLSYVYGSVPDSIQPVKRWESEHPLTLPTPTPEPLLIMLITNCYRNDSLYVEPRSRD